MATGFRRSTNAPRGRSVAARQLEEFMLAGADPARDWSAAYQLPEKREFTVAELVERAGGTRRFAAEHGMSQRTVQRMVRDGVSDRARQSTRSAVSDAQDAVNAAERQAYAQGQWSVLLSRYNGVSGLASAINVHPKTVRRWVNGSSTPSLYNQSRLRAADRNYRLRQTYGHLDLDPGTLLPGTQVRILATGDVHARGGKESPLYDYARNIGIQSIDGMGHQLPDDVVATMFGAMQQGDSLAALDALQSWMSGAEDHEPYEPYSQCGVYDVDQDLGFYFDNFSHLEFN